MQKFTKAQMNEAEIVILNDRIQQLTDRLAMVEKERDQLRADLAAARAEVASCHAQIERLNGRRCKDCKKSNDYLGGDTVYCNKQYATVIVMGDHYCKSWEKR